MSKLFIHLREDQLSTAYYDHPLVKHSISNKLNDDQKEIELILVCLNSESDEEIKSAKEKLTLCNMYLVTCIIGRYLRHWPKCTPYLDDMYAEGMLALTKVVMQGEYDSLRSLRAKIVVQTKLDVEAMLNSLQYPIHASVRTQFRRISEGRSPEYEEALVLNSKHEKSVLDDDYMIVDLLDALETLRECDTEEMIDLVLLALEQQHNIRKQDITDEDRELIEQLVKLGGQNVYSI